MLYFKFIHFIKYIALNIIVKILIVHLTTVQRQLQMRKGTFVFLVVDLIR